MKIIYLTPHSTFNGAVRSDTMWGLLCWGIRNVYSEETLVKFIGSYLDNENKPLVISSVFPFTGPAGMDAKLFFPRPELEPMDRAAMLDGFKEKSKRIKLSSLIKKFKKINYIEKSVFEKFLTGEYNEVSFFLDYARLESDKKLFSDLKPVFDGLTQDSYYKPPKRHEVLHNTIDRITTSTPKEGGGLFTRDVYYAPRERKTGKNNGGLFFLADGDEEAIKLMEGALRFLSHFGFGGDCSTGNNHFSFDILDFKIETSPNPDAVVTLSLFEPTQENIAVMSDPDNRSKCWYDVIARKGKLGGHFVRAQNFWKKTRPLITEGSTLPYSEARYGSVSETGHDEANLGYTAYSYAIALSLPMKIKGVK